MWMTEHLDTGYTPHQVDHLTQGIQLSLRTVSFQGVGSVSYTTGFGQTARTRTGSAHKCESYSYSNEPRKKKSHKKVQEEALTTSV